MQASMEVREFPQQAIAGRNILLAHEDEGVRHELAQWLRQAGYSLLEVDDGPAALAALSYGQFSVLVLGDQLYESSGLEVLAGARRLASLRRTPAIMVGREPSKQDRCEGEALNVSAWLTGGLSETVRSRFLAMIAYVSLRGVLAA